ncbi:MAG: ATP-binding cassette domain-containing protein, partial [Frisingicoccus sp.]|nr:ATP-binding cassette domain-containing protein [Frisingicoccus sp.]
ETDEKIDLAMLMESEKPCVELQNVTFGYEPDITILNNLSFTIRTGEQITLSGRTGAGKSTIFKLILGQYKADSGKVLLYGQDASKLPDHIKRRFFGYVEQHFKMVPGTVLEQITLFDKSISRKMAENAAITVGLHDTICKLEKGYDTPCTAGLFSQGQWQLLSIARAIAAEPKLLLLDEITANLDADTEQTVLKALKKASENRTVLSISHRLYQEMGGRQIKIN